MTYTIEERRKGERREMKSKWHDLSNAWYFEMRAIKACEK